MKCSNCNNEFGEGNICQHCGVDRIIGLGIVSSADRNIKDDGNDIFDGSSPYGSNTICHYCGQIIPVNAKYCPFCSKPLKQCCLKCGASFASWYPCCPECGTNQEEEKNRRDNEAKEKEERERKEKHEKFLADIRARELEQLKRDKERQEAQARYQIDHPWRFIGDEKENEIALKKASEYYEKRSSKNFSTLWLVWFLLLLLDVAILILMGEVLGPICVTLLFVLVLYALYLGTIYQDVCERNRESKIDIYLKGYWYGKVRAIIKDYPRGCDSFVGRVIHKSSVKSLSDKDVMQIITNKEKIMRYEKQESCKL